MKTRKNSGRRRWLLLLDVVADDNSRASQHSPAKESVMGTSQDHFAAGGGLSLASGATKQRIVLVDDDALVRGSFESIVKKFGFELVGAFSDGEEIVKSIDNMNPKPDVIVLDERMPKMSGLEATKIIQTKYPQISIVFVSADETVKERARQAGAKIFLKKPVRVRDLVSALNIA